jgi:hypothetical protein
MEPPNSYNEMIRCRVVLLEVPLEQGDLMIYRAEYLEEAEDGD